MKDEQLRRYARHIILPEIGEVGQAALLTSRVLVVGAGGLGSSAIAYLAAAGVGHIGIIEPDRVELSNLQRQILFETGDIGRSKAQAARDRIHEVNPDCGVEIFEKEITAENAYTHILTYDIVVDGSDNFTTRFVMNDACRKARKPLVSAAISGFSAQISTFKSYLGKPHPCYCCLVPVHPTREITCAQEGIVGPLAGMLGSWQALEVVKELLGIGVSLSGYVLFINALDATVRKIALPQDPDCACANT